MIVSLKPTYVFNLHGLKNTYGPDICIATGNFEQEHTELLSTMVSMGETFGFNVAINSPFDASDSGTLVQSLNTLGIKTIQISISANLRNIYGEDTQPANDLLEYLSAVTRTLSISEA